MVLLSAVVLIDVTWSAVWGVLDCCLSFFQISLNSQIELSLVQIHSQV